jgi:hypothetical protein
LFTLFYSVKGFVFSFIYTSSGISRLVSTVWTGTTVTMDVQPGGGYIFFKRKSNPISARTRDLVIVGSEKNINFVFLDSTVIVEVNNSNNNGTLGTLQSTVVFWDDAEGEMQQYYLKQSFVEYYTKKDGYYYYYLSLDDILIYYTE